jgi:hypothetical protein
MGMSMEMELKPSQRLQVPPANQTEMGSDTISMIGKCDAVQGSWCCVNNRMFINLNGEYTNVDATVFD